jgi:hypothetical protein
VEDALAAESLSLTDEHIARLGEPCVAQPVGDARELPPRGDHQVSWRRSGTMVS